MSVSSNTGGARGIAPNGTLRAAVNLGNPVLAHRDEAGAPAGVSVDLAHRLGAELGVPVELVAFEKAALSVAAVRAQEADVGFFAVDPARNDGLLFTAPYVLIEGSYLVPADSTLRGNDDVDRPEQTVAVGQGSAYDLFLTRELGAAQIRRCPDAPAVRAALAGGQVTVAAGIRQLLERWAAADASLRLLPGRFMVIQQAMGLPSGRGERAATELAGFVERMKSTGFVAAALARHGVEGASVGPPADGPVSPVDPGSH